jgi:hypothetical protein
MLLLTVGKLKSRRKGHVQKPGAWLEEINARSEGVFHVKQPEIPDFPCAARFAKLRKNSPFSVV